MRNTSTHTMLFVWCNVPYTVIAFKGGVAKKRGRGPSCLMDISLMLIGASLDANHWPTIVQPLANHWPTMALHWQTIAHHSANHLPTIGHPLSNHWPTIGQPLANHWPTDEIKFANHWPTIRQPLANPTMYRYMVIATPV